MIPEYLQFIGPMYTACATDRCLWSLSVLRNGDWKGQRNCQINLLTTIEIFFVEYWKGVECFVESGFKVEGDIHIGLLLFLQS